MFGAPTASTHPSRSRRSETDRVGIARTVFSAYQNLAGIHDCTTDLDQLGLGTADGVSDHAVPE